MTTSRLVKTDRRWVKADAEKALRDLEQTYPASWFEDGRKLMLARNDNNWAIFEYDRRGLSVQA